VDTFRNRQSATPALHRRVPSVVSFWAWVLHQRRIRASIGALRVRIATIGDAARHAHTHILLLLVIQPSICNSSLLLPSPLRRFNYRQRYNSRSTNYLISKRRLASNVNRWTLERPVQVSLPSLFPQSIIHQREDPVAYLLVVTGGHTPNLGIFPKALRLGQDPDSSQLVSFAFTPRKEPRSRIRLISSHPCPLSYEYKHTPKLFFPSPLLRLFLPSC
jgi:hypothetical protein